MNRTQHKLVTALIALVATLALAGLAAGAIVGSSTVDIAENETIDVSVDFDGETDATVNVKDADGTIVTSDTLDSTGETTPVTLDTQFSSLAAGEYTVEIDATNDTAVSGHSISVFKSKTVEPVNESVTVDVEFTDTSSATVTIDNSTWSDSTTLSATTDDLDGVDSYINTTEWADLNGTYDVTVEYENSTAVKQSFISTGSDGVFGGIVGGASQTELLAFGAVVAGLVYAYREDYL